MSERNEDKKPYSFLDSLKKKGKEKLDSFIFKYEAVVSNELETPQIIAEPEAKKHPLYALWIMWQKDTEEEAASTANISEEAFLSWFGHDIDLELKEEVLEQPEEEIEEKQKKQNKKQPKEEPFPEIEEEEEEEIKPIKTPAQQFCDSLTSFADGLIKTLLQEHRLAETELQLKKENAKREIEQKIEMIQLSGADHKSEADLALIAEITALGETIEESDDAKEARRALEAAAEVLENKAISFEGFNSSENEVSLFEKLQGLEEGSSKSVEDEASLLEELRNLEDLKPVLKPRDAQIKIYVSDDSMTGLIFLFPALHGGKAADSEAIAEALKKARIIYGIDAEHIDQILPQGGYFQMHTIAEGLLPVNGTDGKIIDHVSRVDKLNVMEDAHGQVDFKQLNIIQNIKKGEPICTLIPAIPGIDGKTITGKVIPCAKVVTPKVPMGTNTAMTADSTQLVATIDGFASFMYSRFNVENKLIVSGNVDSAVGNINFIGDVYIRGDVLNGFEVRAGGDIHINGMAEGAFLYAGKNVHIEKGMNGNKQGLIEAGGEVHCHFLENCTIHAVGKVQADSMVWCDVTSDDSIIAGPGKGAIIGGSVVAGKSIVAQIIGNKSHQKTNITLGYSNKVLRERETSETELAEAKNVLDTLLKNINYLSKLQDLPPEKQELLNQLVHQKRLYEVKKKALLNRLADLDNEISDFSKCYIDGAMIFPPTQVTIGNASRTISNVWFKCHVYYADGEIKFGTALE